MPAPIPNKVPKPSDTDKPDPVDGTVNMEMEWLQYENDEEPGDEKVSAELEDPTVVLDLTSTQVHDLLTVKKK